MPQKAIEFPRTGNVGSLVTRMATEQGEATRWNGASASPTPTLETHHGHRVFRAVAGH